ncbi:MAG: tripartite tricarboxylate transporter substrate-binding protein, partial [Burkholderiales bacterium]
DGLMPQIKAGKLRGLAVTSARRSELAPGLPTVAESGVPGYELLTWFMLVAPAATPQRIVAQLNGEIVKAMSAADVRKRFVDLATDPVSSTPAEAGAFNRSEIAKWRKVIQAAGIRPE